MNSADMSAIAVVNGDADMMAIWHVAVEPVAQTARLCGAWVTGDVDVQHKVVAARNIVVFGGQSNDRIMDLIAHARGVIDLKATLVAIEQNLGAINDIHRASDAQGQPSCAAHMAGTAPDARLGRHAFGACRRRRGSADPIHDRGIPLDRRPSRSLVGHRDNPNVQTASGWGESGGNATALCDGGEQRGNGVRVRSFGGPERTRRQQPR